MCLQPSPVTRWHAWNWSGDEIVHKPIIPASRTIPGKKKRYDIDIREFLTTTNNAVVHEALDQLVKSLPASDQSLFRSHSRGSFDFRADQVAGFLGQLKYMPHANVVERCPDAWLYPDETLAQKGGDCEDLALVLAALLLAAGISSYCVRVALGHLEIASPNEKPQRHDHCWVMYQNELGVWEILEPLRVVATANVVAKARSGGKPAAPTTYVPHYVFNSDHLWLVRSTGFEPDRELPGYWRRKTFWKRFDPSFAASVHASTFDQALGDLVDASALSRIKRKSLWLDANILTYDPCDHFDNAFIDRGWDLVNQRLAAFKTNPTDWESFGAAGHGIGDFYAHSSYVHFATLQNAEAAYGAALPYEASVAMVGGPAYNAQPHDPSLAPFDLTSGEFSVNANLWSGTQPAAAAAWAGQVISGRYAQKHDPLATFWEGFTSIPSRLVNTPGYSLRGSLPHHDEIAVDSATPGKRHKLYGSNSAGPADRQAFANQFRWRFNTATQHIRQAYLAATDTPTGT